MIRLRHQDLNGRKLGPYRVTTVIGICNDIAISRRVSQPGPVFAQGLGLSHGNRLRNPARGWGARERKLTMVPASITRQALAILANWPGFPTLRSVMRELPQVQVFLAGGSIRRFMLREDRPLKDFDLFIDGSFEQCAGLLGVAGRMEFNPYGSPRWYPGPEETPYADVIAIRRFRTGLGQPENMVDLLHKVDFTLNAVAINLRTGTALDPWNAYRDAQQRMMRAVRLDVSDTPIVF